MFTTALGMGQTENLAVHLQHHRYITRSPHNQKQYNRNNELIAVTHITVNLKKPDLKDSIVNCCLYQAKKTGSSIYLVTSQGGILPWSYRNFEGIVSLILPRLQIHKFSQPWIKV